MIKTKIIGLIHSNLFYTILLILIFIDFVILLSIDGPLWGFFCIIMFILLSCIICYTASCYLKKWFKSHKFKYNILLLITFLVLVVLFASYMGFMTHLKAEANRSELNKLVATIVRNADTDEAKTKALLEWFNISKNNIYNNYHLKIKGVLGFGRQIRFFLGEPYIGIRTFNDKDSLWILTSRYGHCGEYGLIFRDMANAAGLNVRKITCAGEDHVWDEVLINGTWIIIDSTRVGTAKDNGYNVSKDFMERKVAGDRGTPEGNVSYVVAEYLIGTTIDVTDRYTKLINVSILAIDEKGNVLPDVKIKVKSNNRYTGWDTGLKLKTNELGLCIFTIGGGDYTFESKTNDIIPLYNRTTECFSENISLFTMTMVLKSDWTKSSILFYGIIISGIIIGFSILFYYRRKKKNDM